MKYSSFRDTITAQWTKVVVTALLVSWYVWMPAIGYNPAADATDTVAGSIWGYLLWPLSHVNVWHLAGNLWVLWLLKGRLHLFWSYMMAVMCSFLPCVPGVWDLLSAGEPLDTVGFSGVLCAIIGIRWGVWCETSLQIDGHCKEAYWTFVKKVLPFIVIGIFIPHVNWSIHLYCLLAGLGYGVAVTRKHT